MRKLKYLLLIAIISFFVLPSSISASAPASLFNIVTLSGGVDVYIQTNEFVRGESYNIMTYSSGGYLYREEYIAYELDENNKDKIQKPDNNDNKHENNNNTNYKVILNDTKFYILAGLLEQKL